MSNIVIFDFIHALGYFAVMSYTQAIFVRHGESIGNLLSQDQRADLDVPNHAYTLTDTGKQLME